MAAVPGVNRVESVVSDPAAAGVDWDGYNGDPATLPATVQPAIAETVRGGDVLVEIVTDREGAALENLVREMRAIEPADSS